MHPIKVINLKKNHVVSIFFSDLTPNSPKNFMAMIYDAINSAN